MKVLVTGGHGLLGSAVIREVQAAGHECVVVQRNTSGVSGVQEYLDDLIAPRFSNDWMKGIGVVIHLAAKVGIVKRRGVL